ncbi:NAD-dependent epimerase/dehydratase family protein [Candidatus Pelagibacter sp.]|jgi:CDP-3, 6-dideoxy-D-glycero-L-glycero-4-hexulose-4-reductase|nr:NAD-dependent epimerase/dehydratase family protein [Candidatus Pelagibacter sp.]
MKIGIIGSNGFLGKNLSIFLKKKNNVKNFSSYSDSKKKWLVTVCKEIKNYAPDIIINCAASQILDDDLKSIEKLIYSNLYSQSGFLDEAKKQKNFIGFITFGSRWEYNQKGEYQPNSFYAATKHASDYLLQYFVNKKITIVSLKIFDTYGKNDNRKKILNLLLKSYKNQTTLKLSPGKQEVDLVNILDICELVSIICTDIKKKKIQGFKKFTVSSKKPMKLIQLIKILKKSLKKNLNVEIGALGYRKNESMKCLRKTYNYPSWKPRFKLIDDLRKIFDQI